MFTQVVEIEQKRWQSHLQRSHCTLLKVLQVFGPSLFGVVLLLQAWLRCLLVLGILVLVSLSCNKHAEGLS